MGQYTREFRTADLRKLLQVDPHVLRALLELEPLVSRPRTKRSASLYTPLDALFLVVMCQLHALGLTPKALQGVSSSVHVALQPPVASSRVDELRLHQGPDDLLAVGLGPEGVDSIEIAIPLRPIRMRLLRYTGADQIAGQAELALLAELPQSPTRREGGVRRRLT